MENLSERAVRAILLAVGLVTVLALPSAGPLAGTSASAALYAQYLVALLAAGLFLAVFAASIRPTLIAGAVLAKAGFVAIALTTPAAAQSSTLLYVDLACLALLLGAGALILQSERREAQWEGRAARPQESYARSAG